LKKVILITEYIDPPYDEGIKKTVYNLFLELDKNYQLKVICRYGFEKENIHIVNSNPLFLSNKIKLIINHFKPDSLIYLPFQSSTFASYLRLKVLSLFFRKAGTIFIALQPKVINSWQQYLIQFIKPEFALTPSPTLHKFWNHKTIDNKLIPLITDLTVFKPITSSNTKKNLRKKYDLPLESLIVSHMGHLNEGRNLKSLIPLQNAGIQVVIVGSSSTPIDAMGQVSMKDKLTNAGIIVLDDYIEHIEEVYQLSDIYVFPVMKRNSSIGMPLSILEARACGIPVLTTDYGSVKSYLGSDSGGIFYATPEKFLSKVLVIKNLINLSYNKTNVNELNKEFYKVINEII